jgi:protein-S-isoprenylcysteine O-methyltransferase
MTEVQVSLTAIMAMIAVGFAAEWWVTAHVVARAGLRRTLGEVTSKPLAAERERCAAWCLSGGYIAAIATAIALRLLVPAAATPGRADALLVGGLAVAGLATGLRSWALVALGRLFNREALILPGHRLLRAGPYRYLQHPGYAATILFAAAAGLALGSWLSTLAAATLALLAHIPRIRSEEHLLRMAFPHTYPGYQHNTGRLVPRVRPGRRHGNLNRRGNPT